MWGGGGRGELIATKSWFRCPFRTENHCSRGDQAKSGSLSRSVAKCTSGSVGICSNPAHPPRGPNRSVGVAAKISFW